MRWQSANRWKQFRASRLGFRAFRISLLSLVALTLVSTTSACIPFRKRTSPDTSKELINESSTKTEGESGRYEPVAPVASAEAPAATQKAATKKAATEKAPTGKEVKKEAEVPAKKPEPAPVKNPVEVAKTSPAPKKVPEELPVEKPAVPEKKFVEAPIVNAEKQPVTPSATSSAAAPAPIAQTKPQPDPFGHPPAAVPMPQDARKQAGKALEAQKASEAAKSTDAKLPAADAAARARLAEQQQALAAQGTSKEFYLEVAFIALVLIGLVGAIWYRLNYDFGRTPRYRR